MPDPLLSSHLHCDSRRKSIAYLAWHQTDLRRLGELRASLSTNPERMQSISEELGHLLVAIKDIKGREGRHPFRGYSVYMKETAIKLRALELAADSPGRLADPL